MMWMCRQCETINNGSSCECEVCGALFPSITISWENQYGDRGTNAVLNWDGINVRSAFAVFGDGRTYYLTKNKRVVMEIIGEDIVDVYFCSTGGYIKNSYKIGH